MLARRTLLASASMILAAPVALRAQAAYPNRPIRMIVPWPPGQATDLMGRVVAQKVTELLGQPIVPENKAGAGGMIGTDAVAKAAPDGYTLLAASTGPITTAPLVQKTPYDPAKDFAPVAQLGISPYVLAVNPKFPAADAAEFVAALKKDPGKFTYASSGTGAAAHLIALMFLAKAGLEATHIPFQGSGPALTSVVAGQVDFSVDTLAATGPLIRQGGLRGLGVSLANGTELAPELPPLARLPGLASYDVGAFGGYMLPAGTPAEIVQRFALATAQAMQTTEVRARLAQVGFQPQHRDTADFIAFLARHRAEFAQVIEANKIRVDQ